MCGVNGIFAYRTAANDPDRKELIATRDSMAARGPDGVGEWWSPERRCAFGHRRLAIQDPHPRANQPMLSVDGRYVITFNGQIYNHPALRAELEAEGVRYRTSCDTETLLHLYARRGPDMVKSLRGMFVFAIWDSVRNGLFLARDPYGIKPIYTCDDGWTFRFASQVKALLAGGAVSRDPEPAGIVGFHLFGSVPEPFSLYRDIRALPAGHSQWVDAAGPEQPKRFASLAAILAQGAATPSPPDELAARVRSAAGESVAAHLLSDVEVGVFLSAGVDSGAMLGLMRDAGASDIRAITLAFEEYRGTPEDEAPLAAQIAARYGARHEIRRVGQTEFSADLPAILEAMDQPSIDGVNTWFVAKATREVGLKVALSGLGGDEILAGYPSFRDIPRWAAWMRAPGSIPGLGRILRRLGGALSLGRRSPKALGIVEYGGTYAGAYLLRRGLFLPFELPVLLDPDVTRDGLRRLALLRRFSESLQPDPASSSGRVCALESCHYLRNQLLRDADWASMAHSVELRTPFVDSRFLAAMAPLVPYFHTDVGKGALARAPSRPLASDVSRRKKTGFVVPTGQWTGSGASRARPANHKGRTSREWASVISSNFQVMRQTTNTPGRLVPELI